MSQRLDVPIAVKALVAAALPASDVLGLDGADAAPTRIGPNGRAIVEEGDPGPAEMDLSPPTYNYQHQIPLQLAAYPSGGLTGAQVIDGMLGAIAAKITADRTLGGLVDYLDAQASGSADEQIDGAQVARIADVTIVAIYSTTHPL